MDAPPPPHPRRLHVVTYGCQMNKLDSETVAGQLLDAGYAPTDTPADADVILINTCSVRQHAEDKVWSLLGKLRRHKERRPGLVLVVMGCMAQREQQAIFRRMPHVDVACGPMDLPRLPDILADLADRRQQVLATDACGPVDVPRSVAHRPNPFQAFVAIMRGCDNFCAYCVVPLVRGREHSRPVADILDEARRLLDDGVKEITLLGQNVNSYGVGLAERVALPNLLRRLDTLPGLQRLRFVTSHPKDASDDLFHAMADLPSVCPHLHLPAQAGSNRILAAMNRRYSREHYLDRVARAKELVPALELASDFIVGFPSETDAEFEETVDLVQRVEFQNCFIFKYSPRPGTAAAALPDDVPRPTKEARNHRLLAVQHAIMERRQAAMVGRTLDILVEGISSHDPTKLIGRSPANHIVAFPGPDTLAGDTLPILITASTPLTLFGQRS